MKRYVLIGVIGAIILAGCVGSGSSGSESSPLTIDTGTVEPGQTGTITITAIETQYVSNGGELVESPIKPDYESVNFSTQPNLTETSYPPNWRWFSPQQNLTVKILYHVPNNTQPGNYTGSISIKQDFDSSTSTTEEYTITVANDTE